MSLGHGCCLVCYFCNNDKRPYEKVKLARCKNSARTGRRPVGGIGWHRVPRSRQFQSSAPGVLLANNTSSIALLRPQIERAPNSTCIFNINPDGINNLACFARTRSSDKLYLIVVCALRHIHANGVAHGPICADLKDCLRQRHGMARYTYIPIN